jgi:hypothetical protein
MYAFLSVSALSSSGTAVGDAAAGRLPACQHIEECRFSRTAEPYHGGGFAGAEKGFEFFTSTAGQGIHQAYSERAEPVRSSAAEGFRLINEIDLSENKCGLSTSGIDIGQKPFNSSEIEVIGGVHNHCDCVCIGESCFSRTYRLSG